MGVKEYKQGDKICGYDIPEGVKIREEYGEDQTAKHVKVSWFLNGVEQFCSSYKTFNQLPSSLSKQELLEYAVSGLMTVVYHKTFHKK